MTPSAVEVSKKKAAARQVGAALRLRAHAAILTIGLIARPSSESAMASLMCSSG